MPNRTITAWITANRGLKFKDAEALQLLAAVIFDVSNKQKG